MAALSPLQATQARAAEPHNSSVLPKHGMMKVHAPTPTPAAAPPPVSEAHGRKHALHRSRHHHTEPPKPVVEKEQHARARQGVLALFGLVLAGLGLNQLRVRRAESREAQTAAANGYYPRPIVLDQQGTDPWTYGEETGVHDMAVPGTAPLGPEAFRGMGSTEIMNAAAGDDGATQVLAAAADHDVPAPPQQQPRSGSAQPIMSRPAPVSLPAAPAPKMPDLSVGGDAERAFVSAEIDRLTGSREAAPDDPPAAPALHKGRARLASPKPATFRMAGDKVTVRSPGGDSFPPELASHFAPYPGEKLLWSTTFDVPMNIAGLVALTDHRLIAVYERHVPRLMPPGMDSQLRRHQSPLSSISAVDSATTRRPLFLIAALGMFWIYPVGTLLAIVALGLYAALTRPQVAITSGGVKRLYPLSLGEQHDLRKFIQQLQAKRAAGLANPQPPNQQAG